MNRLFGRAVGTNLADEGTAVVRPAAVVASALASSGRASVARAIALGSAVAAGLDATGSEGSL